MFGLGGLASDSTDHRERGRFRGILHQFGGEAVVNLRFRRFLWFLGRFSGCSGFSSGGDGSMSAPFVFSALRLSPLAISWTWKSPLSLFADFFDRFIGGIKLHARRPRRDVGNAFDPGRPLPPAGLIVLLCNSTTYRFIFQRGKLRVMASLRKPVVAICSSSRHSCSKRRDNPRRLLELASLLPHLR